MGGFNKNITAPDVRVHFGAVERKTMATKPKASAVANATDVPPSSPDPASVTPTVTHYQSLADDFSRQLDTLSAIIPQLEASHSTTATFVRSHQSIPAEFLHTAIAAVEQTPALQGVEKLNVVAARDTLQFIEAFRPVLDKVTAFASSLKFTISSRKATLAADALQIYSIAKGVARDPGSAAVASLVSNMKRDLKRGRKVTAAARKPAPVPQAPAAASTPERGRP